MSLTGADWIKLNRLLDEVLDLEPEKRCDWMESLPPEYESVRDTLRNMLFRQSGVETLDVLRRAPLVAASPFERSAGDLVGPYRLIRRIGEGGMSTVWLAERADGSLQRQVALKLPRISLMDSDLGDRLLRERDILAALEHPGIARLYDAGVTHDGQPYLAIEYVDGVTLDEYARTHSLSLRQRLALFEQVARAVAYAHARLIVHRDLKPTNVIVDRSGDVHLLDFGIARLLEGEGAPPSRSSARAFTPRYAAPEQFAGESPTIATDVYSLGVILFELLAGRSPYQRSDYVTGRPEIICLAPMSIIEVVDRKELRALKGDLDAILRKALQADPRERYETTVDFIDDIQRYRRGLPVRAHPASGTYRALKFVRRHAAAVVLGGALLATVIAAAGVSLWQAQIAMRERDRALRLYEQVETRNEFWNMVLTEAFSYDEPISIAELLKRSEAMAEATYASTPYQYALATDAIAGLYIIYGMDANAHGLTSKGLARIEQVDSGSRAAAFRCSYAVAMDGLGRAQEADEILRSTIEQLSDEPDLKQYCLQCRFYVAHHNNRAVEALEYIQEAYRLSQQLPVASLTKSAQMLSDLARAYALNGKSDLANEHYAKAMKVLKRLGRDESRSAFDVLSGWGNLGTNTGNPAVALERFEGAIAIQAKHSPNGQPALGTLGNRANALASLGRFDDALRDYERMRAGSGTEWGSGLLVYATGGIADIHLMRGDLAAAQATVAGLTEDDRATVSDSSAAAVRLMIVEGRILTRQGKFEEAYQKLTRAVDAFDSGALVVGGRARTYLARAELLIASGRLDDALQDAQRAIEIAKVARGDAPYSNFLGLAELMRGDIQLRMKDRAAAEASLRAALKNLKGSLGEGHPETQRAQRLLLESSMT